MARRFFAIVCSALIAACMLPALALAEGGTWQDVANTDWYKADQDTFEVSSPEQLAGLAKLVNDQYISFRNKTIKLTKDIDLSDKEWTPIGTNQRFEGTFDGGGHVVSHMKCTQGSSLISVLGLFGNTSGALINRVGVEDAQITIGQKFSTPSGILCGYAVNTTIQNCWTTGTIAFTARGFAQFMGGVVGALDGHNGTGIPAIIGCWSNAKILCGQSSSTAGGIAGQVDASYKNVLISDCWFGGSIKGGEDNAYIAGIAGNTFNNGGKTFTIKNCAVCTTAISTGNQAVAHWLVASYNSFLDIENSRWPESAKGPVKAAPFDLDDTNKAFTDKATLLADLKAHGESGINWVMGTDHPTFDWDYLNDPADLTALNKALAAVEKHDDADFADPQAMRAAVKAAKDLKAKRLAGKDQKEVGDATAALKALKLNPANCEVLNAAIAQAKNLHEADYKDFSKVKAALKAAEKLRDERPDVSRQNEVIAKATALADAIDALVPVYPPVVVKPAGGSVTVTPKAPKEGDAVTVEVAPPAGKAVGEMTVTDASGKAVEVTERKDGSRSFVQPKGKVTVRVSYKDASGGHAPSTAPDDAAPAGRVTVAYVGLLPKTGDASPALPLALAALSGVALAGGALARRKGTTR